VRVRTVGVFHMTDEKGPDEKVLCVPLGDPSFERVVEFPVGTVHGEPSPTHEVIACDVSGDRTEPRDRIAVTSTSTEVAECAVVGLLREIRAHVRAAHSPRELLLDLEVVGKERATGIAPPRVIRHGFLRCPESLVMSSA
jgi:hypothetical protein